ncbi:efflux RND transporter permease subunit [Variovorax ginsengisoli]|uniref:Efflux pump membrane transporter n=1 Tax=Variovorax ginsengisoli TaxID=363844 RepID=A0ABT8SDB8_9BURK|nr:efflux RND transporter permease subunit [Variovorax ginsengisoli]MDN8617749.1 efflux RND transporter permease subunit [Variovorax ginsengisoli]MDO1536919.1 efflux RND transporter permease subunit [Variovorax ginsengisoli]
MARFFIGRPIFAIVLAILVMLAGALSIFTLPVEQYPQIAPPTVQVTTSYPGASATTVQDTVVQVIEQSMSGLDHLLYLSSVSDDTGQSTTTLTFAPGTNPDIAEVQVQNKLQLATPLLPAQVQQTGVRITKSSSASLLVAAFVSTDGSINKYDIANYVASHVQDPLSRLEGVGNLNVFGTQYAMRIWLDLQKLYGYSLTPVDVTSAVSDQNVQVSGGQLGGAPAVGDQQLTATITAATLLRTPEDFGAILLKVQPDGSQVRLRDVARIELGAENFAVDTRYNGKPAAALAVQLGTGANALQTANAVRARIDELSKYFPPGLKVVYPNDSTPFIKESIKEVVKTLFEGIALVFLVMFLFLQNIRATIIPTIAVPVVLLGTFGVMAALGFTVNTLSMFGLVLAIGLLVDDAIVVVENVQRVMEEEGLSAVEATRKAMGQISGALVGVVTVLCAVFVPVAFSGGTVGAIYRQFSLTIVAAMLLSVLVALTLTPALCAMLLKRSPEGAEKKTGFFGWFNRRFERSRERYASGVRHVILRSGRWLAIYAVLVAAVGWLFVHLPTSFLPTEDQGFMYIQVQTPPGATMERTGGVLADIGNYLANDEKATVEGSLVVNGFNFAGRGQSQGLVYVQLKDWHQRQHRDLGAAALSARLARHFASYKDAIIIPITPPAIQGLGTASGFDFELEDRGGVGQEKLTQAFDKLLALASHDPDLALVRRNGLANNPTFRVDVDREKASALGVAIADADQAFSIAWGSKYVNNFLDTDGRIKKVYVQADAPFRMNPEDLDQLYVRNVQGGMAPFSSFSKSSWTFGPPQLQRYNGVPAIEIQGQAAPGRSTGQAIATMERLMKQMPEGIGYEWTGVSLQQQQSGSQAPYFYALSILVVFLCLAALYESWAIPLSVILVIPLGVLGALGATTLSGLTNDVYFQVGLLTTIGLSAKNAILIVEFARELQATGRSAFDAAIEAAHMRLRPIVMTSLAFGLGVLPLALAKGAGSASQNAIGVGVIGGMATATFLAIFLIPMFYVVIAGRLARPKHASEPTHPPPVANSTLEGV